MAYDVSEDGITVSVSDEICAFPDKVTPTPGEDGVIMYYELLNLKEKKNVFWREKLGEGLKKHFKDITTPKAILTYFPLGYKLYAHRKKYPKKGDRTDIYLFGRHKFRSPNEFIPHLIWLASDKSGQCHCKYCIKSSTTNVVERVVPVAPVTRAKRRRDVDSSDDAPSSKRITRSSSMKNGKNGDDRKKATDYRKKVTNNRNKADVYNRKKAVKKSSKKKRKSKSAGVNNDIPPPVPKYAVFREGEIVWLVIDKVLNDETLSKCNKVFPTNSKLEYWPATIGPITPQDDDKSFESTVYSVKPLLLHGNKNVTIDSLRPWLAYNSEKAPDGSNRFTRSLLNIDLDKATPEQIVEIYFKAIQKASEIEKIFTPMYKYNYRINEQHDVIYFRAMYLGAELIYEDDLIRLIPEGKSELKEANESSYLQVTSIFEGKQGLQVTGDLYEKDKLLDDEWIPKNKVDEEYTIDISDIAGRFYSAYSDIVRAFECDLPKTFENRMLILSEDGPPTTVNKAAISPSTTTSDTSKHPTENRTAITPIITKRTGKRISPLPPISTMLNLPVPSILSDEPSKRIIEESEIKDKISTNLEIKIADEKEFTIKQISEVQETKSIEKNGSPVKFSDIERRYTKKSDEIDLPPLVVSPDTPTFETDDEGDVWGKINANNGSDNK